MTRAGIPRPLGARAFDLLLALIDRRGQVVSKDELIQRVWPGLVVEENNLTVQMSALREAIGAGAVETVPQRGYQLTADLVERAARAAQPAGNLPAPATRLLGRDSALAALAERLRAVRLLTLTGAGGIGKSRLALEAAAAATGRFADGAWLIELASVADAAAVGHAVAGVMGIAQQPGARRRRQLERQGVPVHPPVRGVRPERPRQPPHRSRRRGLRRADRRLPAANCPF